MTPHTSTSDARPEPTVIVNPPATTTIDYTAYYQPDGTHV